ncbi:MAG: hypothetical protein HY875_17670 [Chloroflexi bacterium]|nr:hypothetical protein [Chloroflexota bacterium]
MTVGSAYGRGASGSEDRAAAAIYALAAVAYYAAHRFLDLTFDATPLVLAVAIFVAGLARARFAAPAIPLACWGIAALLVRHGPLADEREAAALVVALGLGIALLGALEAARVDFDAIEALYGTAAILVFGGAVFYLGFEYDWLMKAWAWSLFLLACALYHFVLAAVHEG